MAHEVRLEVFQGPIDLLLQLITRQRVDIYEVSLSTITDEYLSALAELEAPDLETATGFLVVAATLLELKSIRLLPGLGESASDQAALEERDLLLARLLECSTFTAAGRWLLAGLRAGADLHPREVNLEPRFSALRPNLKLKLKVSDVTAAAARILASAPVVVLDTSHVRPTMASVRDAIAELAAGLSDAGTATFESLCGRRQRIEVVVRFLGLLELFKAGAVTLSQSDRFGAIAATWTGEVDLATVLDEADEYAVTEGGAA